MDDKGNRNQHIGSMGVTIDYPGDRYHQKTLRSLQPKSGQYMALQLAKV